MRKEFGRTLFLAVTVGILAASYACSCYPLVLTAAGTLLTDITLPPGYKFFDLTPSDE